MLDRQKQYGDYLSALQPLGSVRSSKLDISAVPPCPEAVPNEYALPGQILKGWADVATINKISPDLFLISD